MTADAAGVLVISHDVIGSVMAGPGIRYYHLARVLAQEFAVTLAAPAGSALPETSRLRLEVYQPGQAEAIYRAAQASRAVLLPAIALMGLPRLADLGVPLVMDGYDPYLAEILAIGGGDPFETLHGLTKAYLAGDFFICASERQRDWWLGLLEANGRVNRVLAAEDPSLRSLVDLVPFGLTADPPQHTRPIVKGIWPGIGERDRLVLWGGGLWPWLDAETAVRAVASLAQQRPDVRLLFPGTRHPNPVMSGIDAAGQAIVDLARQLGVLDRSVFFGEWVPYADWPNVLLESDVALALHHDTLETRLAFRSRALDYMWAGLPAVMTCGDATSEIFAAFGIGKVVNDGDVAGVAAALLEILDLAPGAWHERFSSARREFTWERVAAPLLAFCRHPRIAPDRAAGGLRGNPMYVREAQDHLEERAERERWQSTAGQLRAERDAWQSLAQAYAAGRFMRLTRWLATKTAVLRRGVNSTR